MKKYETEIERRDAKLRAQRKYKTKAHEFINQKARERYHENPAKDYQYKQVWRKANPEKYRAIIKRWYDKLRKEVVTAYGGQCACCGEQRIEFLAIDHVHNNGAADRKENGRGGTIHLRLKRMGYPKDDYQLLCHNCNMAKAFYGTCPHVTERGKHESI